jgi:uncharacterized protein (UPF0218 family)
LVTEAAGVGRTLRDNIFIAVSIAEITIIDAALRRGMRTDRRSHQRAGHHRVTRDP